MAENTSVGSVQLDIEINPSSINSEVNKVGKAFSNSFKNMFAGMFKKNNNLVKESMNRINNQFKDMAQVGADSSSKISKSVGRMNQQYEKTQSKIAEIRKELAQLFAEQDEIIRNYMQFPTFSGMTKEESIEHMLKSDTKYQGLSEEIDKLTAKLDTLVKKEGQLADELKRIGEEAEKASTGINKVGKDSRKTSKSIGKMTQETKRFGRETQKAKKSTVGFFGMLDRSFRRVIRRIFILNLIYKMIRGFMNYLNSSLKTNSKFVESLNQIKTNLMVAFQPIYDFILPAIQALMRGIATATHYIAAATSAIFGKSYQESFDAAKKLNDSKKAMDGYGKSAKKAAGSLMGFDEINALIINRDDDVGGNEGFEMSLPDQPEKVNFGFLDKFKERLKELTELFKEGFTIGVGGLDEFNKVNEQIKQNIKGIKESLKNIFTDAEVTGAIRNYQDALALNLGKVAGSMVSIGQTIAANLTGGIDKYLKQNQGYIKERIVSIYDVGAEVANIVGDFAVAFADIFSVFRGEAAQQITADLIGIFSNAFLGIADLASKVGRDILDLMTAPIINNKDKIKTALENTLKPVSKVINSIRDTVTKTFEKIHDTYDKKIKPLFESFRDGLSDTLGKFIDVYNTHFAPVLDRLADKFSEVFKSHLQPLLDEAIALFGDVADMIKALWENALKPLVDWAITNILPILAPIFETIGMLALNLVGIILDVVKGVVEALRGIIQFLTGVFSLDLDKAIQGIKKIFEGIVNIVKTIVNAIVDFFKWLYDILVGHSIIPDMVNAIVNWFNNLFEWATEIVSKLVGKIIEFFKNLWKNITEITTQAWNKIKDFIIGVWNGIKESATKIFNSIKEAIGNAWDTVKEKTENLWNGVKEFLERLWNSLIETSKTIFTKVWDSIKGVFSGAKEWFSDTFTEVWEGVKKTFDGIIKFITGVFSSNWKKAWEGVRDIFSGIVDTIAEIMRGVINGVIDIINGAIAGLNSFKVPEWVPGVGGKGVNIPMIPRLARGGIIDQPTLALVGEQGKEAVVPLENTAFVDTLANAVGSAVMTAMAASGIGESGGYSGDGDIVLQVGEAEFGRIAIKAINTEQARVGKTLLNV